MKAQSRIRQIEVEYKGWHMCQAPWSSYDRGGQYAKYIFDPEGKEKLHAGYSNHMTRKELKRSLKYFVDVEYEELGRLMEEYKNKPEELDI